MMLKLATGILVTCPGSVNADIFKKVTPRVVLSLIFHLRCCGTSTTTVPGRERSADHSLGATRLCSSQCHQCLGTNSGTTTVKGSVLATGRVLSEITLPMPREGTGISLTGSTVLSA